MLINTAIYASISRRKQKRAKTLGDYSARTIFLIYKPELQMSCTFSIWKELLVSTLYCSVIDDYELSSLRMLHCF